MGWTSDRRAIRQVDSYREGLAAKEERHTTTKTSMARFPFHKSLETFDFKFQPSIDPEVIRELATVRGPSSSTATSSRSAVLGGELRRLQPMPQAGSAHTHKRIAH